MYEQYLAIANSGYYVETGQVLNTSMSVRPFSSPESFAFPTPPRLSGERISVYSRPPSTIAVARPPSPSGSPKSRKLISPVGSAALNPLPSTEAKNPFEDPALGDDMVGQILTVFRPFEPRLADELLVSVDDRVLVLKVFDDGWALVKKMQSSVGQGLIPVHCIKGTGQDMADKLLIEKRSSSAGLDTESSRGIAI